MKALYLFSAMDDAPSFAFSHFISMLGAEHKKSAPYEIGARARRIGRNLV